MNASDAVFYGLIALALLPVVLNPAAWPVGAVLVAVIVAGRWVLREALDIYKTRQFGKASGRRASELADKRHFRGAKGHGRDGDAAVTNEDDDGGGWR